MTDKAWDKRYREGDAPWDTNEVNGHLPDFVGQYGLQPCRVLDLGCGTGTNAIWFARQGFDVTGIDVSGEAIRRAREKAAEAGVECRLLVTSAAEMDFESGRFGLAYDCGCLHTFNTLWDRAAAVAAVALHLDDEGLWLSLLGSTDGPPRESGPPRRSALELAAAVEPHFEILELGAVRYRPAEEDSAPAWRCVMRKRRRW